MKKLYYLFCIPFSFQLFSCTISKTNIAAFGAIGDGYHDDTKAIQRALNNCKGILVLENKNYLISKSLVLKSNLKIEGNGAVIKTPSKIDFHIFQIINSSKITISNINFIGNRKENKQNNKIYYYNPIIIKNSSAIYLSNLYFKNSFSTCIKAYDVTELKITDCQFENIGVSTKNLEQKYSYSGIFIGGYKISKNISILNCSFKNIGVSPDNSTHYKQINKYRNDGNGIQILMLKNGKNDNFIIKNCDFYGCSRRGIKIQTGQNIEISHNTFRNCGAAIGLPMVQNLDNIKIFKNNIEKCIYAISPNSTTNRLATNLSISNNIVKNINNFLTTNGNSMIVNSSISKNNVDSINLYFISGLFKNTIIEHNKISNYALVKNKSYYMAFLIWENSSDVFIKKNLIQTCSQSRCAIYIQQKVKNTTIRLLKTVIKTPSKLDTFCCIEN